MSIGIYFVLGMAYVVINGLFRKFYEDDDGLLVFAHLVAWPIAIACLIIESSIKLTKWLIKWIGRKLSKLLPIK